MQPSRLSDVIESFADALGSSGAAESVTALRAIARTLACLGPAGIGRLEAIADTLPEEQRVGDGTQLEMTEPAISGLVTVLRLTGARKQLANEAERLLDLVRRNRETSISSLESHAIRSVASASRRKADNGARPLEPNRLVASYLERLEAALGNDGVFRSLLKELDADKRITRSEAIELASLFFSATPQSTSRPKAIQRILHRHEKLMESRAASASIGGRAA
jgi:hypothetical protein